MIRGRKALQLHRGGARPRPKLRHTYERDGESTHCRPRLTLLPPHTLPRIHLIKATFHAHDEKNEALSAILQIQHTAQQVYLSYCRPKIFQCTREWANALHTIAAIFKTVQYTAAPCFGLFCRSKILHFKIYCMYKRGLSHLQIKDFTCHKVKCKVESVKCRV